jgi:hypothetical protein
MAARVEERNGGASYGVMAAARLRAAWLRARGGGVSTGGAAAARQWHGYGVEERRRRGRTTVRRRHGGEADGKENLTVATLYRLDHRLIRCCGKRMSVQI